MRKSWLKDVDENLDTTKVYNDLRKKISLIAAPEVIYCW